MLIFPQAFRMSTTAEVDMMCYLEKKTTPSNLFWAVHLSWTSVTFWHNAFVEPTGENTSALTNYKLYNRLLKLPVVSPSATVAVLPLACIGAFFWHFGNFTVSLPFALIC